MSLDWYAGQKCALVEAIDFANWILLMGCGVEIPRYGAVYTVKAAIPCPKCGAHIELRELTGGAFYPCGWFRPIDPKAMETLRELLTPIGGLPVKEKEPAL